MRSPWFEVNCHPAWRKARELDRRVIILPDGNHRKHDGESYRSGADNVVACAERIARRGDVSRLLVCVVSRRNAEKRPGSFFARLACEFGRLRSEIAASGVLLREGIRCHARGELSQLRAMGKSHGDLVEAVEAVCAETRGVTQPRMELEFCLNYPEELAWEQDVDLVVRTGAEEANAIRPGFWLPSSVPCIVTTSLWPDASAAEIENLVDEGFAGQPPHFAPGYDMALVAALIRALPTSRIPVPLRLTIPVCASSEEVTTMLEAMSSVTESGPAVFASYMSSRGAHSRDVGPSEDAWYAVRLVPAAQWVDFANDAFEAILAPGQCGRRASLAIHAAMAPVHTCEASVEGLLDGLGNAVRYPVNHVMLGGASRSLSPLLVANAAFPADLMDLMQLVARKPNSSAEELALERLPRGADAATEREVLIKSISAKVLSRALTDGLLLRDEALRQADRNYAYTGAYMMLRVPDEANPSGSDWEPSAELAIRCMLTLSTGDNGIFDRVIEGEAPEAWRCRLEEAARYLGAVARGDITTEPPTGPGARIVGVVGRQWQTILERHANGSPAAIAASRDALARHYAANLGEYAPDIASSSLVRRLGIGGRPRQEAIGQIEERYAGTMPAPVMERVRTLVHTKVHEPSSFAMLMRELELVLRIADTASGMGIEVLFSFCALPSSAEVATPERIRLLVELARYADYAFRLANDIASLADSGRDRDHSKQSSVSIIIPRGGSASSRETARELAKRIGKNTLAWLYELLGYAISRLRAAWPMMAEKVQRAMLVGRGVYERAHYTTTSSKEMLAIIERADLAYRSGCTENTNDVEAAAPRFDRKSA